MGGSSMIPCGVDRYDNPETIRVKKYLMGSYLMLEALAIETGRTPKEVVWAQDKVRLYHYTPTNRQTQLLPVPILLVYALILLPYILDLIPGNSFVEYLVAQGLDVHLLDWGIPDRGDAHLSLDDCVLDYLAAAVERVMKTSRAERVTLLGYCMGGTMCAMYTTLCSGKPVKNLVLLATPIDFAPQDLEPFGRWTLWADAPYVDPDLVVAVFGNLPADAPARLMEIGTRMLSPLIRPVASSMNLWRCVMPDRSLESLLAVSKWVDDGIPFPGRAFQQWVRDFYQHNKLIKGELMLRGHQIDLANITCPVLTIAGAQDTIAPLSQTKPAMRLVGSHDKELLVLDAGHIGLMASPVAKSAFWPQIRNWLAPRS